MKTRFFTTLFLCFLASGIKLSAQSPALKITELNNSDNTVELIYEKGNPGKYYIGLEFANATNCNVSNYNTVISDPAGSIMKIEPIDPAQKVSFSMKYYSILGELNPKVDSLFRYVLPFKYRKKINVLETRNVGEKYFEKANASNWKSYAVQTETPDTVYSMRKGVVVFVKDEYKDNSVLDALYTTRRNQVIVEHADGTYASYKGFKNNEIFVKVGQTVYPQSELGVIEKYDKTHYRLDFNVYYLTNSHTKPQNLSARDVTYKFLEPVFYADEGEIRLYSSKEYTVSINKAILTKEFTASDMEKLF